MLMYRTSRISSFYVCTCQRTTCLFRPIPVLCIYLCQDVKTNLSSIVFVLFSINKSIPACLSFFQSIKSRPKMDLPFVKPLSVMDLKIQL